MTDPGNVHLTLFINRPTLHLNTENNPNKISRNNTHYLDSNLFNILEISEGRSKTNLWINLWNLWKTQNNSKIKSEIPIGLYLNPKIYGVLAISPLELRPKPPYNYALFLTEVD
jgi:hypothetical protein